MARSAIRSNINNIVDAALPWGSVAIMTPPPSNPTATPTATQLNYVQVLQDIAQKRGLALFDFWSYGWGVSAGNYSAANMADNLHPNQTGYATWGTWVANQL